MSNSVTRRRAGRPQQQILSRERIIEAAFAVADQRQGDFSVSSIARALGVQAPAIYNYFANKIDIIAGMRGVITQRVDTGHFERLPWYEAMIPWATNYLEAMVQHPGIIATLATIPVDSEPESITEYDTIVRSFTADDYPQELIVPALVAVESFIIGSALDALTPEDNLSPDKHPEIAPGLLQAEGIARQAAGAAGVTMSRHIFQIGLRALVTGLRELPTQTPTP